MIAALLFFYLVDSGLLLILNSLRTLETDSFGCARTWTSVFM